MEVETKNASLDTLAVTILALHVSGKQMTQAVFKQLPEARETDDSELWGIVRYTIKDAGDLWLVFSQNGRLFRRALDLCRRHTNRSLLRDLERGFASSKRSLAAVEDGVAKGWLRDENVLERSRKEFEIAEECLKKEQLTIQEEETLLLYRYETDNRLAKMRQLFIAV